MPPRPPRLQFERTVLGNGLKVVVVPDPAATLVGVAVVYNVGFRSEPEGRTGFAHLFEHMMFQGSAHVGKVEHIRLIESAGGVMNGHTLPDLTAYYEALPPSALELALFLEADRMSSLVVSEENLRNQVDVVKEEILVNVLNRPYGGFPWIPLPALAFDKYPNAHNGYGDFTHLEQATVKESKDFYNTYYTPANAVLAVVGVCRTEEVVALAERHFGHIRKRRVPAHGPWPEKRLTADRHRVIPDPHVPQPAFAIGYRTVDPVGELDRYLVYHVLADVLAGGEASRLRSRLVHKDQTATDVACILGVFGDDYYIRDPSLLQVVVYHPGTAKTEALLGAIDEEIERLASEGPTEGELRRVVATSAAEVWRSLDSILDRAHIIASIETVHGRAELIAELAQRIARVTPADLASAAADLAGQRRAVLELQPAGAS
ncbi:MAG TPA: pitrilysin family protein [Acidimicrobiales bacterium]|nr:pitrilysin family protein [Acidimicrobiales bacterium]